MSQRFAGLTKNWTDALNTEWLVRFYHAARLIMASTLRINASNFATARNLVVAAPYLRYYGALDTARALCLTLPDLDWEDGELLKISHRKALQNACAFLSQFDQSTSLNARSTLDRLKAERELFSYTMPSDGPRHLNPHLDVERTCSLLADAAEFVSELLVSSLDKHADGKAFKLDMQNVQDAASTELEGHLFTDDEDMSRLFYLYRRHPRPAALVHMLAEGHVEDFFGAWSAENDGECQFDPDSDLRTIFDVP